MFALLFVVLATYRKVYYDLIENLCFILLSSATTFCFFHCSNVLGFKVHSGEVWQCGDLLWRGFRWDRSGLHLFPYGTFLEISHDDPINAPWCFSNTILVLVWGVPLGQAKVKFSKGFLAFFFFLFDCHAKGMCPRIEKHSMSIVYIVQGWQNDVTGSLK